MGSLTDYQREVLDSFFMMKDFRSMWDIIYNEYETKHLDTWMYDDDMLKEFQYINQQLRKYISSHQDQIMDHGSDFEAMLKEIEELLGTASEYADNRKELIYNFLRDQWLVELHDGIVWLMENADEEEE